MVIKYTKSALLFITIVFAQNGALFAQEKPLPDEFPQSGLSENAEVHYLSYQALSEVSDAIVNKFVEKTPDLKSLIICGSKDCNNLVKARLRYQIFSDSAKDLIAEYDRLERPTRDFVARLEKTREADPNGRGSDGLITMGNRGISGAGSVVSEISELIFPARTLLTNTLGLANLLRSTNVEISSQSVSADDSELATAIVGRIKSRPETSRIQVYLPGFAQMENISVTKTEVFSSYRILLNNLRSAESFESVFARYSKVRVGKKDALNIAAFHALKQRTEAFLWSLTKAKPDSPEKEADGNAQLGEPDLNLLENLIKGEKYASILTQKGMILRVKVIKLIGTRVDKSNLIMGNRTRFSGSATVQYVLTDASGNLVYANTEIFHTGFKKMKELRTQKQQK